MRVTLHPATSIEWQELLKSCARDISLAQTFEFGEAVASAFPGYVFTPLRAEFSDGAMALWPLMRVRGRLPFLRRFEAMPPSLNGFPVPVRGEVTEAHLAALVGTLGADMLNLNGGVLDNAPIPLPRGDWEITAQSTHVLDVSDGWDAVWQRRFTKKARNQCRTAWKKGVVEKAAESTADFDAYYQIYADSSRRWGYKKPPYPPALFQAFAQLRGRGVELKMGLVENRPIAGIVLLHGRRSTLYWSGAMLEEFSGYSANNGLLEVAIREACSRGQTNFDFGASGSLESVRRFKEQFGAMRVAYESLRQRSARHEWAVVAGRVFANRRTE